VHSNIIFAIDPFAHWRVKAAARESRRRSRGTNVCQDFRSAMTDRQDSEEKGHISHRQALRLSGRIIRPSQDLSFFLPLHSDSDTLGFSYLALLP